MGSHFLPIFYRAAESGDERARTKIGKVLIHVVLVLPRSWSLTSESACHAGGRRRARRDWDHEEEVRAFVPTPGLRKFVPDALTGIVFGTKTTDANKAWVQERIEKGGLKVKYYQAIQSFTHFELEVRPA